MAKVDVACPFFKQKNSDRGVTGISVIAVRHAAEYFNLNTNTEPASKA